MAAGKTRASSLIGFRSLHICVNVRFGYLADPLTNISLMSASGGKADVVPVSQTTHLPQVLLERIYPSMDRK